MDFLFPNKQIFTQLHPVESGAILIGAGFASYLIFKRYEPDQPIPLASLILIVPSLLVPAVQPHISTLPGAISATFASYYALLLFCVINYRLSSFHPLAKYPGPFPNRLTKLWMVYISSKGKQHIYYRDLHEKYGDVVRIGPNELSVRNADAIQPILGPNGLPKGPFWSNRLPPGAPVAVIAERDPAEHIGRRRPWNRAFSSAAIKNYEEILVSRSRELVEALEKRRGETLDLSMWMSFFSFDFMSDMAFGGGFDLMRTGCDSEGAWNTVNAGIEAMFATSQAPWLHTWIRLIPGLGGARERFFSFARGWGMQRIKQGPTIKDIFYHLNDEEGLEPVKPPMPVVISEAALAVIAGSDTTASTLTAIWYFLMSHPMALERLRSEVDSVFPAGDEVLAYYKTADMSYLNGVINEALRLLPPVISGVQRSAAPGSGGKLVGQFFIPEGNQVFVHTYSVQRDPRYFSLPNTFWPDRWIPAAERKSPEDATIDKDHVVHNLAAFIPFSSGPANCAGKNLALLELRAVICIMVQRFDFQPEKGFVLSSWEEGLEDLFVINRPPLPVVINSRY